MSPDPANPLQKQYALAKTTRAAVMHLQSALSLFVGAAGLPSLEPFLLRCSQFFRNLGRAMRACLQEGTPCQIFCTAGGTDLSNATLLDLSPQIKIVSLEVQPPESWTGCH